MHEGLDETGQVDELFLQPGELLEVMANFLQRLKYVCEIMYVFIGVI